MRGDELEPLIRVQCPQKRMPHVVLTGVAPCCLFDKRRRPLPYSPQVRQHLFLLADCPRFKRGRCLSADHTRFNNHHRNVKPFEKWHWFRRFLQQLVGPAEDGPLDHAQVADQFTSRPAPLSGPRFPFVRWNGICGAQNVAPRASQIFGDGCEKYHSFIRTRAKNSDGGSSSLLENMGQLQDAPLSKSRSKDLQAHRQLSVDLAARYGHPWDSCQ